MHRGFHVLQVYRALGWAAALVTLSSTSGCFTIDWGSYRVGDGGVGGGGEPCNNAGVTGRCEVIPEGWTLVRATVVGDPSTPAGTCSDASPQTVYFTQPGGQSTCSPCKCSLAPGATCSAPELTCSYMSVNCAGADSISQVDASGCLTLSGVPLAQSNPSGSCKLTAPGKVIAATCDVTQATATNPPLWGGAAVVCNVNAVPAGCGTGALCVDEGPSADGAACILRAGTDPCPAGWGTSITAFTGGDDHRGCSACSCVITCVGGGYIVYDNETCMVNDPAVSVMSNSCTAVPNLFDAGKASVEVSLAKAQLSTCDGGQPQGQVDGKGPVQICCK